MGIMIYAEKPPAGSDYDQWKVYRSSTRSGSYSVITTQAITDLSYFDPDGDSTYWYKVSYYDQSEDDESGLSTPFQGNSNSYTTIQQVQSFLRLPTLSDTTNPTLQEVSELIAEAEDAIDQETGHAWRVRYSNTAGADETQADYEYYDINHLRERQLGTPVYLKHRKIRNLDADAGDALEFWNGNAWEDWIATKTESRNGDFWLDYDQGILYIRYGYFYIKGAGIRMKYRYGEATVNKDIQNIAKKMVAIDVLSGMDSRNSIISEGSAAMRHSDKVRLWQDQIDAKIEKFREIRIPNMTGF